ncbi:phosphoenolpyruvate-protein phosphotransferase [Desulfosarcina ovata subsp. sediminis]|uniref:Phosphoenolpyruvate-protein phosphotransferase n=1 Tax=Desulfosarcina ovata subsp. sediminis TaxID=885957 RepID=A0A5K7ZSD3_9BACT|nr:phosphoenolpyruvate-protein phosphotransferase [Desulfosarcina ovata subsp. sediminis]
MTLLGKGVSPGMAQGKAFVYKDVLLRDSERYLIDDSQIDDEKTRIKKAIDDVRKCLTIDAKQIEGKLGKQSADIFRAQEAILFDPQIGKEIKRVLETQMFNAEQVIRTVFRVLARRFRDLDNEVLRERGDDIDDLSRRLLLSLAGIHAHSLEKLPANTVLVARRLLPSDTVFLSRSSTVGVLAEFAGPAAHAALLARELGIPCIGGIPDLLETVHTGNFVLVDGTTGTAVLNPNPQAMERHKKASEEVRKSRETMAYVNSVERTVTSDGIEVSVMANVRSREDVELAMQCGADGIGLFRAEPFFLSTKHLPSAKKFATFLLESLEPARGRHIDVRLLDIGADKNPIYLHLPPEPDPSLGRRGVRVLHEYPELLDTQLRAVLEVSQEFGIGILIPMVTVDSDVLHIVSLLQKFSAEMGICRLPRIGAMIETPAAALSIASLRTHVDFFSIGSNDLTQYTMAAGRENPLVAEYFIDDHPTILRLIELVVRESGTTPVSICGELAGRVDVVPKLLKTGIRSLSVAAALVPDVKFAVRKIRKESFMQEKTDNETNHGDCRKQ